MLSFSQISFFITALLLISPQCMEARPFASNLLGEYIDNPPVIYYKNNFKDLQKRGSIPPIPYPKDPKNQEEMEEYMAKLNTYFMIFGRPR